MNGPRILMKRDDQTGLASGGNKTRKLEFLIGEALATGCDTLVTGGAAQSNHCRQTVAAAACCGLRCHLALGGEPPTTADGNLLLDNMLGAHIHWTGKFRKGEKIPDIVNELEKQGHRPYVIPYGGSNPRGALGFVDGVAELIEQLRADDISIDAIVFASSSGGTHAGLMVGKEIAAANFELIGIAIDKEEAGTGKKTLAEHIAEIATGTAELLHFPTTFTAADVTLFDNYTGKGYGMVGKLEKNALRLIAKTEGILLDPVYTGRAMGGLLNLIDQGKFSAGETVLFWHTGGLPALFSYAQELQ